MSGVKAMNKIQRFTRKYIKKRYETIIILGLIMTMCVMSGLYVGFIMSHDTEAVKKKSTTHKTPLNNATLDDRYSRMLSGYVDTVIGGCYYDAYQQNDTHTPTTGNICDSAMLYFKEICKSKHYDACNSEFLRKYLEGMGQ